MKDDCSNLYLLTTIACQLAECLNQKELEQLSADLTALGYLIESLLAHRTQPLSEKELAVPCKLAASLTLPSHE